MSVRLDPAEGRAYIGELEIPFHLTSHDGAVQINGKQGPCLLPISFLERSRLASYASVSRKPSLAMAKLVTEASLLSAGDADPVVTAIIALVLAGADKSNLPSYAESALLVTQASGWSPEQLGQPDAVEIDMLAKQLVPEIDDGWVRLRFNAESETDLKRIQNELADNLLVRLQPGHTRLNEANHSDKASLPPIAETSSPLAELSARQQHGANQITAFEDEAAAQTPVRRAHRAFFEDEAATQTPPLHENSAFFSGRAEEASGAGDAGALIRSSNSIIGRAFAPSLKPDTRKSHSAPGGHVTGASSKTGTAAHGAPPVSRNRTEESNLQPLPNSHPPEERSISSATDTPAASVTPHANISSRSSTGPHSSDTALETPALNRRMNAFQSSDADSSTLPQHENASNGMARRNTTTHELDKLHTTRAGRLDRDAGVELEDLLDELAARLHQEADLRGIDR